MKKTILFLIVLAAILLAGCAQNPRNGRDQNDLNTGSVLNDENIGVSFKYPSKWIEWPVTEAIGQKYISTEDGEGDVMFSKSEDFEGERINSAKEYVNKFLEKFGKFEEFSLIERSSTTVSGLGAETLTFSFKENGNLAKAKIVVTEKHNNNFYHFSFVSSNKSFKENILEFDKIIQSIQLK